MAYLGIDIGSLYVSLVLVDRGGEVLRKAYARHHGEPLSTLSHELSKFPLQNIQAAVSTGSGAHKFSLGGAYIDAIVAQVKGVNALEPDARNIIYIGGGSFSLTRLDEEGNYEKCTSNSACASGTGAFLDQQALRLQVPPMELTNKAMSFKGRAPNVATRCAVFAKSDMIHLQQEGYSTDAIAAGLCAGLGRSTVDGLLSGRNLEGKTVCIGGVALNQVVVDAVQESLGVETVVPDNPELVSALGAALYGCQHGMQHDLHFEWLANPPANGKNTGTTFLRPPLELKLSKNPERSYYLDYVDEYKTEIALISPQRGTVTATLGFDIGSTSTKAALLDNNRNLIAWAYRKTAGNPIEAVQRVLHALRELARRTGFTWDIQGV
ncbi:MAG: hypothetical protein JXA52_01630, partial [Planctomycetes bacterium]|nr:hypothetical protein [Planctomycetota bacterium]